MKRSQPSDGEEDAQGEEIALAKPRGERGLGRLEGLRGSQCGRKMVGKEGR